MRMKRTFFIIVSTLLAVVSCSKNEGKLSPDPDVPEDGTIVNVLIPENSNSLFTIPVTQIYNGVAYPESSAPQWGSAVYPEKVVMQELCGKVEFKIRSVKSATITKMTLNAKGGEFIAGTFGMGFSNGAYNGTYVARTGCGSSTEIIFNPAATVAGGSTLTITVPVLGGRYSRGFMARIYNDAGHYAEVSFCNEGGLLEVGKTYSLPVFEYDPDTPAVNLDDYDDNIMFDSGLLGVGTYNILNSTGRTKSPNNTWDAAKATISSIIMDMDCDVMSIDELGSTEIEYLHRTLTGYEWITKANAGGKISYAPGIIYRPSRLEKLSDGIFWLSDPDAESLVTTEGAYKYVDPADGTTYKASSGRVCVWAIFRDLVTGKEFCWFAPHPHIRGDDENSSLAETTTCLNAGNLRSLVKQIPYVNVNNLPIVVAGDMNTWSGHVSYIEVLSKTGWSSAFDSAIDSNVMDATTALKPGTNQGYNPANYSYAESRRIDHIYYDGFSIKSYKSVFNTYVNVVDKLNYHPSDHLPVKVTLQYQ